jgi:plasmid stabilization system protein ParE
MHLEWARPALRDIKEAGDFIASDSPHAAERMAERIR